eukprot:Gb_02824 [translate_table: standard]
MATKLYFGYLTRIYYPCAKLPVLENVIHGGRIKASPPHLSCSPFSRFLTGYFGGVLLGKDTPFGGADHCVLLSRMESSQPDCYQSDGRMICSAKAGNAFDFAQLNNGLFVPILSRQNQIFYDMVVAAGTACVALACLRFWDEMAKRDVFDQTLNRKLVHVSIGLVFMLLWPLFSTGPQAAYLAALAPAINVLRMIALGIGLLKNEAMVKSMSRHGDARELLKGPLYYAGTITLVTVLFWRASPISPITIANLCAGDGFADIAGRRLGTIKLPHNKNKSFAGSFTMFVMGLIFSVGYLFYFASFGFYEVSSRMLLASLFASVAATIAESLPISTELDDNLIVPLVSVLVGCLIL